MKKINRIILSVLMFCTVLFFNVGIIKNSNDQLTLKIEKSSAQASWVPGGGVGYLNCRSGQTTYIGNDGVVIALWCGDCCVHAIYDTGAGDCRLW